MAKMTAHEVLTAINAVRKFTSPPNVGETKRVGIDETIAADELLLALQERLLDDYGDDAQSIEVG